MERLRIVIVLVLFSVWLSGVKAHAFTTIMRNMDEVQSRQLFDLGEPDGAFTYIIRANGVFNGIQAVYEYEKRQVDDKTRCLGRPVLNEEESTGWEGLRRSFTKPPPAYFCETLVETPVFVDLVEPDVIEGHRRSPF